MKIIDLLLHPLPITEGSPALDYPNPLIYEDALLEVSLVGVMVNIIPSFVALMFDLRVSLYDASDNNTGIIILRHVKKFDLQREPPRTERIWTVASSRIILQEDSVLLEINEFDGGSIVTTSKVAEYIVGRAENIGNVGAEITNEDVSEYLDTIPHWYSNFEVKQVHRLST
jgi:hypothetical protein